MKIRATEGATWWASPIGKKTVVEGSEWRAGVRASTACSSPTLFERCGWMEPDRDEGGRILSTADMTFGANYPMGYRWR